MPTGKSPHPVRAPNLNSELFAFSFAPNAGSNPVATSNIGAGFSVTWVSAGKWLVTVNAVFNQTPVIHAFLQTNALATGAADLQIVGAITMASGVTTFNLVYRDAAVATNLAANANTRIHVFLYGSAT